jgi:hypothetical protein
MTLEEIRDWLFDHREEVVGALQATPDRLGELSTIAEMGDDPDHAVRRAINVLLDWPGLGETLPTGFNEYLLRGRPVSPRDYSEDLKRAVEVIGFVKNSIRLATVNPQSAGKKGGADRLPLSTCRDRSPSKMPQAHSGEEDANLRLGIFRPAHRTMGAWRPRNLDACMGAIPSDRREISLVGRSRRCDPGVEIVQK